MSKGTIVVNRGTRTYHLINGENGETRTLPPGGSIELLDEKEAKHLLRYHDIQDMKDASPQTAAKIRQHEAEIKRLTAENERLQKLHPGTGDSIEEMNEASAGTGFEGPGGPVLPQGGVDPDTEPTRQETAHSEEAREKAEKANRAATGRKR